MQVPADGVNIGDPGTTSSTDFFNLIVNELQSNVTDTCLIPPVYQDLMDHQLY